MRDHPDKKELGMHNSEFFYDQEVVTRCGITPTEVKPQNSRSEVFL
jgi:hypothetical protein